MSCFETHHGIGNVTDSRNELNHVCSLIGGT